MRQYHKVIAFLGFFLILAILLLIGFNSRWMQDEREVLVVWGQHEEKCLLWFVDPYKPDSLDTSMTGTEDCNYMIAIIDEKPHLIHIRSLPGAITVYEVDPSGEISIQQTFSFGDIEVTSAPQWDENDNIYFSAIADGQEAIYRFEITTEKLERLIFERNGMVTNPLLSPNSNFLSYLVLDEVSNRYECTLGFSECEGAGDYYVLDIHTDEKIALDSLVQMDFPTHVQDLIWSKNGNYLAFDLYEGPAPFGILDIQQRAVVDTILEAYGVYGWLSDQKLAYQKWDGFDSPTTQLYSMQTGKSYELTDSSLGLDKNVWSAIENLDWTDDGVNIVGVVRNNEAVNQIVMGYLGEESPKLKLTTAQSIYEINSMWSVLGNWVAVPYAADTFAYFEGKESKIDILNREGQTVASLNLSGVANPQFGWLFLDR